MSPCPYEMPGIGTPPALFWIDTIKAAFALPVFLNASCFVMLCVVTNPDQVRVHVEVRRLGEADARKSDPVDIGPEEKASGDELHVPVVC